MAKLETTSALFIECKRTADSIRGKRNLSQMDSGIIMLRTAVRLLGEEGILSTEEMNSFLTDPDLAPARLAMAGKLKALATASNNVQNGLMVENELLESNKSAKTEDYAA